jgi:murein DD-endopeptidase MepM/ murein hydrolase activator NlpD
MANYRFRYNPETLKYERLRVSVFNAVVSVVSVAAFSAILLAALLYLQYHFAGSDRKQNYRKENALLVAGQQPVRRQIELVRRQIAEVMQREGALFNRLFGMDRPSTPMASRAQLLTMDAAGFHRAVRQLINTTDAARRRAAATNVHFYQTIRLAETDLHRLAALPTLFPVKQVRVEQVVSGFGKRLNPWHKGHYHHQGIDITQPREAPVLATGAGVVQLVKRSDLLAGYGNHIEINHGNGFVTRYAHLGEIRVRTGQRVEQGAIIALVGLSGSSVAPHVHYEVLWQGAPIDPLLVVSENLDAAAMSAIRKQCSQFNQALD